MKVKLTYLQIQVKFFSFLFVLILSFTLFSEPILAHAFGLKELRIIDLKMFEGSYQLLGNQNAFIKITAYGDQLTLKESWSNNEISFKQTSELSFVATDHPDFTLDFARDQNKTITQVVAFKRDVWVKVKTEATTARLSPSETEKLKNIYQTIFTAFEEAINTNSDEKIKSFLTTYMEKSVLASLTIENLTMRAKELYQNTG
ncbi:MAG: hypothetical protein M3Q05_14970, partial [Bacteroidota bacterium]|nr:hypothetical protein [Bacteroidota bacterium]